MRIYKYEEYIKEAGIGGVTVGGVNFGSDRGDVGNAHFGRKGDPSFDKRGDMNPIDTELIYSEHTGDYYSQTDIRQLLFKYHVWCKQNNEECLEITNFDTKTLDYILKTINSE